jgi:selenobiotic family peptide radical SAM maturase
MEIYSETVKRGFSLSIAAKPISTEKLEKIASIRKPEYFELKLEGLKSHSDSLLGKGNFSKTVSFLDTLNNKKIKSAVMLTLTKSNINQVLPLAEFLKDKTDCFSFARPASTGLGPVYDAPEREKYKNFIDSYITASMNNPIMGYKENLINIELKKRGMEPYGGCSGFGCGAAFCFLALFPGGDVHACGKINSPLGNIKESTILEIYSSEEARQYRIGPEECASCALRKYCGGCSAVATAFGFDCSKKHDPYCFIAE